MTIGAALVVILAGVLIAAFLNSTIGLIVAAVGVVGLILAAVTHRSGPHGALTSHRPPIPDLRTASSPVLTTGC